MPKRPVAYRVFPTVRTNSLTGFVDIYPVEGPGSKSLQRAYRRAKRVAKNVNGTVKAVYEHA